MQHISVFTEALVTRMSSGHAVEAAQVNQLLYVFTAYVVAAAQNYGVDSYFRPFHGLCRGCRPKLRR